MSNLHLQHSDDPQRHTTQMLRESTSTATHLVDHLALMARRAFDQWLNRPKPQDLQIKLSKNVSQRALSKESQSTAEVSLSANAKHNALQKQAQKTTPTVEVELSKSAVHTTSQPPTNSQQSPRPSAIYRQAGTDRELAQQLFTKGLKPDAVVNQIKTSKIEQGFPAQTAQKYAQETARAAEFQVKQGQQSPAEQISRQRNQQITVSQ